MIKKINITGFNQTGLTREQALSASAVVGNEGIVYFTCDNAIVINGEIYGKIKGAVIGPQQTQVQVNAGVLQFPDLAVLTGGKIDPDVLPNAYVNEVVEMVTAYWNADRYYRPIRDGVLVDAETFAASPRSYVGTEDYFDPSSYEVGTIIYDPTASTSANRYKIWKNDGSWVGSTHYESASFLKGKLYNNIDDDKCYRWGGHSLVEISKAPGTTNEITPTAQRDYVQTSEKESWNAHVANSAIHVTSTDKTNWNGLLSRVLALENALTLEVDDQYY